MVNWVKKTADAESFDAYGFAEIISVFIPESIHMRVICDIIRIAAATDSERLQDMIPETLAVRCRTNSAKGYGRTK